MIDRLIFYFLHLWSVLHLQGTPVRWTGAVMGGPVWQGRGPRSSVSVPMASLEQPAMRQRQVSQTGYFCLKPDPDGGPGPAVLTLVFLVLKDRVTPTPAGMMAYVKSAPVEATSSATTSADVHRALREITARPVSVYQFWLVATEMRTGFTGPDWYQLMWVLVLLVLTGTSWNGNWFYREKWMYLFIFLPECCCQTVRVFVCLFFFCSNLLIFFI